ncbi:MAG: four helix bundle protein [Salegentibacter sp.]
MAKTYRDLEVYKEALALFYRSHKLSLKLPKYELYELGSQLRRSSDSIITNIVEGYGRRKYKGDFLKFLTYAHASNDETILHLEKITALYPEIIIYEKNLLEEHHHLGTKIFRFIKYVEESWKT